MLRYFVALCLAVLPHSVATAADDHVAHNHVTDSSWIGTWSAAPQPFMPGALERYGDETLRLVVHVSAAGSTVRVRFSNAYGDTPLTIGRAHVARRTRGADIDPASDRALTFAGSAGAVVPPHGTLASDAVNLDLPALSDLAVSLHLPQATPATTSHLLAQQTSYVATGDAVGASAFPVARTIDTWPFLTGVDVVAPATGATIVVFGDSTVDGDGASTDGNGRWPDVLAARLQRAGATQFGVLNQGIIGNRLLHGSPGDARFGGALGEAGLVRFERDALAQPGVKFILLRSGGNDIRLPGSLAPAADAISADKLIAGYRRLVARAHERGIRMIGTTIPPAENATLAPEYHSKEKEKLRQVVNAAIRAGGVFDALVDADLVLRDPSHPTRLLPAYDSGDHLHPNDAGYAALGEAVPLGLFGVK